MLFENKILKLTVQYKTIQNFSSSEEKWLLYEIVGYSSRRDFVYRILFDFNASNISNLSPLSLLQ